MGNNPSRPKGKPISSPVASHSSSSSTNHIRKEPRTSNHSPEISVTQSLSTVSQPSPHLQNHSASHTPADTPQVTNASYEHSQADKMGNEQSRQNRKEKKNSATPVRVPRGTDARRQKGPDSQFEPSGPPRDLNYIPHSNLNFPPRLPLPIEEELHTPGSPIITPSGVPSDIRGDDVEDFLPNRVSVVSNTTLDDDEVPDELQPYPPVDSRKTVPTLIEWKQGGNKVYVTGTFASWSRKFRMSRE